MPAERRRRRERPAARRTLEGRTGSTATRHLLGPRLLKPAFNDKRALTLTDRRVVVHVIPTQIDLPRHRNARVVDRGPGGAHAGADFAAEVHGAVGVVVGGQDPGAET